nr:MAG TPA: Regulatory protein [Caudoviricetes sp.]
MTNTQLLRKHILSKGYKYKYLAKEMGLSPYGLQKKIDNNTEFKASEIKKLVEILNLSSGEQDKIFFA